MEHFQAKELTRGFHRDNDFLQHGWLQAKGQTEKLVDGWSSHKTESKRGNLADNVISREARTRAVYRRAIIRNRLAHQFSLIQDVPATFELINSSHGAHEPPRSAIFSSSSIVTDPSPPPDPLDEKLWARAKHSKGYPSFSRNSFEREISPRDFFLLFLLPLRDANFVSQIFEEKSITMLQRTKILRRICFEKIYSVAQKMYNFQLASEKRGKSASDPSWTFRSKKRPQQLASTHSIVRNGGKSCEIDGPRDGRRGIFEGVALVIGSWELIGLVGAANGRPGTPAGISWPASWPRLEPSRLRAVCCTALRLG